MIVANIAPLGRFRGMIRSLPIVFLALSACSEAPLCSSEIAQVARDPGSDRYATTASRNCGATTDYATVVRVGRASERQADAQEVFVADSDHGAARKGGGGRIWTEVVWTKSGQLSINYASGARVFKQLATAKQARISYRATDPYTPPPPS
jgi:hypothetical protein